MITVHTSNQHEAIKKLLNSSFFHSSLISLNAPILFAPQHASPPAFLGLLSLERRGAPLFFSTAEAQLSSQLNVLGYPIATILFNSSSLNKNHEITNAYYFICGKKGRKRRQYHNDLERQRRDHLKGTYQELRDVLPNNAGHRLSRHETLKETHKFLSRFKEAKKKHNFNFTVEEACSLIQEERERMLGLIKKAKAKNIDLDVVPGFQQFVETHNFNEGAMSYLKPRQTPKPRTNPRRRLRRRDPTST